MHGISNLKQEFITSSQFVLKDKHTDRWDIAETDFPLALGKFITGPE